MKHSAQSMTPQEAATAFYGQDDEGFDTMLAELSQNDPRLMAVFRGMRARFLGDKG